MPADVVQILEAAYRVELSEQAWLEGVAEAFGPSLDHGLGLCAYLYDASDLSMVKILRVHKPGNPVFAFDRDQLQFLVGRADPEYIMATWRGLPVAVASQSPRVEQQPGYHALRELGVVDALVVNGIDGTWKGCNVSAFLPRTIGLAPAERATWSRVAAHVASGLRLRCRLEASVRREPADGAEAILDARGRVVHAHGEAGSKRARTLLVAAGRAMDRARTRRSRAHPVEAVAEWKGLIAARWTLLDHFDSDGRRYLFACHNDAAENKPGSLSAREYQVAALLSLGHSTKLIAYELGISPSTVRVLLSRAAAKLRVRSREALARLVQAGALTRSPYTGVG